MSDIMTLEFIGRTEGLAILKENTGRDPLSCPLQADVESVHELKGFRIILGLFSVSGFEDELYHSDAILIDKGRVAHNLINGMKTV